MSEASENEIPEQPAPTVSEVLVAAREARGLSQKEVADQLFLTSTFIRYLDEGQFEKIPKPAFIKGYMRSYARVVGLKGDEVVAQYEASLQNDQGVEVRDVTQERVGSASLTGPVLQTGLVGLVVILVVCALVWMVASGDDDEDRDPMTPAVETQAVPDAMPLSSSPVGRLLEDSGSLSTDQALSQDDAAVEADSRSAAMVPATVPRVAQDTWASSGGSNVLVPETSAAADQGRAPVATDGRDGGGNDPDPDEAQDRATSKVEGRNKEITIERTRNGNYRYITVDAGGFDQLEVSFTDECWIEVEDGDGQSIYADLNRKDDVLTIYGIPPFEVLLGRASAVALQFNSASVDLARYTSRDQTAKVRLGDDS